MLMEGVLVNKERWLRSHSFTSTAAVSRDEKYCSDLTEQVSHLKQPFQTAFAPA